MSVTISNIYSSVSKNVSVQAVNRDIHDLSVNLLTPALNEVGGNAQFRLSVDTASRHDTFLRAEFGDHTQEFALIEEQLFDSFRFVAGAGWKKGEFSALLVISDRDIA